MEHNRESRRYDYFFLFFFFLPKCEKQRETKIVAFEVLGRARSFSVNGQLGGPHPVQPHTQTHRPPFTTQKTGPDALSPREGEQSGLQGTLQNTTSQQQYSCQFLLHLSFKELKAQCDKTKPPMAQFSKLRFLPQAR